MTPATELRLPARGFHVLLPLIALLMAVLGVVSEVGQYVTGSEDFYGLGPLVDLDYEGNLPDWHLSMLMLVCAGLLLFAGHGTAESGGGRFYWRLLSALLVFLSADHIAGIDDPLIDAVFAQIAGQGDVAILGWIGVGVPLAWLAVLTARAVLRGTSWRVKALGVAAIAVYALSYPVADWEYPLRLWFDAGGQEGGEIMIRDLLGVLDHALQTLAASLLCSALLELILRRWGVVTVHVVDGDELGERAIPASA